MSNIYSIERLTPVHTDKYFVDTNVWFWLTYCASREINTSQKPRRYQLERYPEFIEKALDVGAKLFHCPLVFSELANVIERTEYEIFKESNSTSNISRKKFRSMKDERANVISEIKVSWSTVNSISTCLDIKLGNQIVPPTLACLEAHSIDPYDAFYLQVMSAEGITKLITDDRDFVGAGVQSIYTANLR